MNEYEIKYVIWDIPNLTDMRKQYFTCIIEVDDGECVEDYANEYLQQYFATGNYMIDTMTKVNNR